MRTLDEKPIIQFNPKVIICKILGHKTYEAKCRGHWFGYDCIRCGSRFQVPVGKPDYPNFDQITKDCKKKIDESFIDYGNSWKYNSDDDFWKIRIQNEIDEIWESENPKQMEKEIIDAVNVLAMTKENVRDFPIERFKILQQNDKKVKL